MKTLLFIVAIALTLVAVSCRDLKAESLAAHNKYRTALGIPELVWSSSLGKEAQSWANRLARNRRLTHTSNTRVGENLASGSTRTNDATTFVELWAEERQDFIPENNYPQVSKTGDEEDVEHYSQMIWEGSTKLGCGIAQNSGKYYYVCQYYPKGNINGQPVYTVREEEQPEEPEDPVTEEPVEESDSEEPESPPVTEPEEPEEPEAPVDNEPEEPETPVDTEPPASSDPFIAQSLAAHNKWRSAVGVSGLTWNATLAKNAQAWADTIAKSGKNTHSKNRVNTGENIAFGTANSVTGFVDLWGAERKSYVATKPYPKCTTSIESDIWHYTQLVWQKSTQVGCGMGESNGKSWYVCQYYPRGNVYGAMAYTTTPNTPQQPEEPEEPETPVVTEPEKPEEPETPVDTQPPASSDPFIAESLAAHHKWRSAVGVPDLVWNTTLARNAQQWAETIARNGRSSHSQNRVNTGENIAYGTTKTNTITGFVGLWGAESKYFVRGKPYPKCTTGSESDVWHYTQLVWRKTTQLGCGIGYSNGRSWYVCQYYPRGNMIGQSVF